MRLKNVREKDYLCVLGIGVVSYHTKGNSVFREIVFLANRKTAPVSPLFWMSGIIWRVCTSPKVVETRALVKVMDDTTSSSKQLTKLLSKQCEDLH